MTFFIKIFLIKKLEFFSLTRNFFKHFLSHLEKINIPKLIYFLTLNECSPLNLGEIKEVFDKQNQ